MLKNQVIDVHQRPGYTDAILCGLSLRLGASPNGKSRLERPGAIDGIRSQFRFEGEVRQAAHHPKYQNVRSLAAPLSELLAGYLSRTPVPGEVLVPVPLHSRRLRERGYNQAALLARQLSEHTGLPVADGSLVRVKRFPVEPMEVEDAIERMELLGHSFFLFLNSDSDEANLVYRRRDGDYNVIEPEVTRPRKAGGQ